MRKILLTLFVVGMVGPAAAQNHEQAGSGGALTPVEAQFVCMVNDQSYEQPQIEVDVGGKTYYGCCQMCKARLQQDAAIRSATDPVSGAQVDKATAIIGAAEDYSVHYFESIENLQAFNAAARAETGEHPSGNAPVHGLLHPKTNGDMRCEPGQDCAAMGHMHQ